MMKRRNAAEVSKNRKCLPKRARFGDGSLNVSSVFLAVKLVFVWLVIVALDFAAAFRLEYFWPVWLMMQSVADAYKYQGIGFTVFFISMVVTSDILVYMFVPTAVMFFLASLYVWIQLMMLSGIERGLCLQTVVIWMVFLYIEATVRLREMKADTVLAFQWDICRPFAAHCVGYPLVTFSFSVKSFIGFRYRKHKQSQISTENQLFRDLINEALPDDCRRPLPEAVLQAIEAKNLLSIKSSDPPNTNGFLVEKETVLPVPNNSSHPPPPHHNSTESHRPTKPRKQPANARILTDIMVNMQHTNQIKLTEDGQSSQSSRSSSNNSEMDLFMSTKNNSLLENSALSMNNDDDKNLYKSSQSNGRVVKASPTRSGKMSNNANNYEKESVSGNPGRKQQKNSNSQANLDSSPKQDDLYVTKLESDIKRLKSDLQSSRQFEQDLRSQLASLQLADRGSKAELAKMQLENETLQHKLNALHKSMQVDKANLALVEKKFVEEKKARALSDAQLTQERKQRRAIEEATPECTDNCKNARKEMEMEVAQLRRDLSKKEEKMRNQGEEIHMKQFHDSAKGAADLATLQEKNAQLERSLRSETQVKLDLFCSLKNTNKQLDDNKLLLGQRDKEVGELKLKISRMIEAFALVPGSSSFGNNGSENKTPTGHRSPHPQDNNNNNMNFH